MKCTGIHEHWTGYKEDLRNKEHEKIPSLHLEVNFVETDMVSALIKCTYCIIISKLFCLLLCLSVSAMVFITLSMQCNENSKQIFPERILGGFIPNFCIHGSVSYDRSVYFAVLRLWTDRGNRLQIHECRNWERGRAVSFLGLFVSNFRFSAFSVW